MRALILVSFIAACGPIELDSEFPRVNPDDPESTYELTCIIGVMNGLTVNGSSGLETVELTGCGRLARTSDALLEVELEGPVWTLSLALGVDTTDPLAGSNTVSLQTIAGTSVKAGEAVLTLRRTLGSESYASKEHQTMSAATFAPPRLASERLYYRVDIIQVDLISAGGEQMVADGYVSLAYSVEPRER